MSELAPYTPPGAAEIDYTWNLANKLCKTEFVPQNLRNRPEATLAVFLTGRELGIGPMQSLRDIYPVNGRPALMASLMVARVRGLGHRFRTLESTDTSATVQIHRKGDPEPEPPVTFTTDDARRAGLLDKVIWRQYPKAMHWNRAASAACRRDCPEALGGAVYTPEEIEDGNMSTTATWGAPEASEQSGGLSGPSGTAGDDVSGSPPGQSSGEGERQSGWAKTRDERQDPSPDPKSPPTPVEKAHPTQAGPAGVEGANDGTSKPGAGASLPDATTPPEGLAHPPGRSSGGTTSPAGGATAPSVRGRQSKTRDTAGRTPIEQEERADLRAYEETQASDHERSKR